MNPEHRKILEKNRSYLEHNVDKFRLRESLIESKLFTSSMLKDVYEGDAKLFEELPTRGPKAFYKFLSVLRDAGYNHVAVNLEKGALNNYVIRLNHKDDTYHMSHDTAGCCLIINNMQFDSFKDRTGSDKDEKGFEFFFQKVGYKVICRQNKTAEEMFSILQEFSESDFKNQNSCIVIILSHGGNDKNLDAIYGKDGNYILLNEILAMFNKSEDLVGKPKVFFIQACRDEISVGKKITETSLYNESAFTDILLLQSTLPYHESYRHTEKGAYFCQCLIQVLNDHYCKYDLLTMTHFVEDKMQIECPEPQVTTVTNYFFKKKLCFK
ncbi:caspase-3-like [Stegodyphus dumicola]|uniref:caspase-3-like n=1 Tax=Stegodyphus dumicola TaxID=202533 RepID=UPI0015AE6068|nr:caspase-3-like [Stegodyphus dumicola]